MRAITFFLFLIPILALLLLSINFIFAPHSPYQEKSSIFECGFHSFLGQNRSEFELAFFVFGLLFMIFDLDLLLVYPYPVSSITNGIYGLTVLLIFLIIITIGFVFEIGKKALQIDSRQNSNFNSKGSIFNIHKKSHAINNVTTSFTVEMKKNWNYPILCVYKAIIKNYNDFTLMKIIFKILLILPISIWISPLAQSIFGVFTPVIGFCVFVIIIKSIISKGHQALFNFIIAILFSMLIMSIIVCTINFIALSIMIYYPMYFLSTQSSILDSYIFMDGGSNSNPGGGGPSGDPGPSGGPGGGDPNSGPNGAPTGGDPNDGNSNRRRGGGGGLGAKIPSLNGQTTFDSDEEGGLSQSEVPYKERTKITAIGYKGDPSPREFGARLYYNGKLIANDADGNPRTHLFPKIQMREQLTREEMVAARRESWDKAHEQYLATGVHPPYKSFQI